MKIHIVCLILGTFGFQALAQDEPASPKKPETSIAAAYFAGQRGWDSRIYYRYPMFIKMIAQEGEAVIFSSSGVCVRVEKLFVNKIDCP